MLALSSAIGWLILCAIASVFGEWLLEMTEIINRDKELKGISIVWFSLIGLTVGAASAALISVRVVSNPPFPGISLAITPAVLAALMAWIGGVRRGQGTHLATWYGGASLGLGLALGRLVALAFISDVRAV